jgi:KaiC/GvpD/RAD55 family RecA-like ATPase
MLPEPIVSNLVLAVLEASSQSLSSHYEAVFKETQTFDDEYSKSLDLARGWTEDLSDRLRDREPGFSHASVTRIFFARLSPLLRKAREGLRIQRGVDRHIWSQDYDRQVRSLFPTGAALGTSDDETLPDKIRNRRTRVSAIVQQALLLNRRVLRAEKSVTSKHNPRDEDPSVFVPSPFYIAFQILTDPEIPASEAFALAAIRCEIKRRLENNVGSLSLSHENLTKALDVIRGRSSTSKRARSGGRIRPEALFLFHYLAAKGVLALQLEWTEKRPDARVDRLLKSVDNLFEVGSSPDAKRSLGTFVGFRLHPDHSALPTASELLNELEGLPLPVEGASAIFHRGLRFGSRGDIVAAISGPFGAGKTSVCLSLAASLAPLGCRTLFLSCEETDGDIQLRLEEARPHYVAQSTPLFRFVSLDDVRGLRSDQRWFQAHKLRLRSSKDESDKSNVVGELKLVIDEALNEAPLFEPFRSPADRSRLPPFARRVIVIDGFHQLFREEAARGADIEHSLRELIDHCRDQNAVFFFTVAAGEPEMHRLEYLCDLVIELGRRGFDSPSDAATRIFKVLKARRQPAMTGAHLFHITGEKGFRVKLNVASHADNAKTLKWIEPTPSVRIFIGHEHVGVAIQNRGQILVYGRGSSGKAGLGLYILHRRPIDAVKLKLSNVSADLFETSAADQFVDGQLDIPRFYESRTLVVSFLYQGQYYRTLGKRFPTASRLQSSQSSMLEKLSAPNHAIIDTIPLYPGRLTPEDFLAKVENRMRSAELRGLPYTGVLIDGIHNVFVQFPQLQDDIAFWPQLYNLLRRRGVTVVTTHTEFELAISSQGGGASQIDFEHARKRMAPLLSVLVSSADYRFELSAVMKRSLQTQYRLYVRGMLGEDPPTGYGIWNRQQCRLESWQGELPGLAENRAFRNEL